MNVQCTATVRYRWLRCAALRSEPRLPNHVVVDCRPVFLLLLLLVFFFVRSWPPTALPDGSTLHHTAHRGHLALLPTHRLSCVRAQYVYLHHSSVGTVAAAAAVPNPNPFGARTRRRRSTTVSVTKRIHRERVALSTSWVCVRVCIARLYIYIYIIITLGKYTSCVPCVMNISSCGGSSSADEPPTYGRQFG